ncbi:MAG: DUF1232 domain-containing protein [Novosphingobium sp.]
MIGRLRAWARRLKVDIVVMWLAARDPRVPLHAKLLAGLVAGYALSPIDLIPDFIPIVGLLDDLLLVPLGIWLVLRLIPPELLAELRLAAREQKWPGPARKAALLIVGFWLAGLVWLLVELRKWNWLAAV